MGCCTTPFGAVGVPVPITSSALTNSGDTGSPAASLVPFPCGVSAFELAFDHSAFEPTVHAVPFKTESHIS